MICAYYIILITIFGCLNRFLNFFNFYKLIRIFIWFWCVVRYTMMAGKDELDDCDIIKQGLMVKRSQNKKRFMPINYKQRWFVLTTKNLIYYESESEVSPY